MPLTFAARAAPAQRLDLSALVQHRLAGLSQREIAKLDLATTREPALAGDVFAITGRGSDKVRFAGTTSRCDYIGAEMIGGEIAVEGDAGIEAGRGMRGGRLVIRGSTGPLTGSGMADGRIEIGGDAGERLGGPRAGEMAGMAGGLIVLRGNAGARAGDRLRRGVIIVEGDTGGYAGSRMIAGTLIVAGRAGALPGYLQKRGTLLLGAAARLSPGFVDCGVHDLTFMRLLARWLAPHSAKAAALAARPIRRWQGDMAAAGQGELFLPA